MPPIIEPHNREQTTDPQKKCDIFGQLFSSTSNIERPIITNRPFQDLEGLTDVQFTTRDVSDIIMTLQVNKSPGVDTIGNRMIKTLQPALCQILPTLFRNSFEKRVFPSAWKRGIVTPIYKNKGDKKDSNNYRPITLTCCLGKIMEVIVNKAMLYYLESNNKISAAQSGFRKKDSTVCQLISIIHMLLTNCASKKATHAVFLDISKAFDSVWHDRLITKLSNIGINGRLLYWLEDYLKGRSICVAIEGKMSNWYPINAGVPQGAILAPLLFLVFINDLPELLESLAKMYADDTSLFSSELDPNVLQNDLTQIERWATQNDVTFNADKTKYMLFSKGRPADEPHQYTFYDKTLEPVKKHKHLGVTLSNKMSWEPQINVVVTKMTKLLNMIKRSFST